MRADAVSVALRRPRPWRARRQAEQSALPRLLAAAAAVFEACVAAAAAAAGGAAEGFEATLIVEERLLPLGALHGALDGAAPPGLEHLTGLHLPAELFVCEESAGLIAARCPRLKRLSFGTHGRQGQLQQSLDGVLALLSALPLEELAVRCPACVQGSHLRCLMDTPAGRSLRSLELWEKVWLHSDGIEALFSFPRLERIASRLFVSPEAGGALREGLARHGSLREAHLILEHVPPGAFVSRLGEAIGRSPLAALHLEFESGAAPFVKQSGAGAVLRSLGLTVKEPPAPDDLAALAARGPPLASVALSLPLPSYPGDVPPGYDVLAALAPLGPRLEVRLLRETYRETAEQLATLAAFHLLLPAARVELRYVCKY
eukprot:tig00000215_g18579.t1